MDLRPAIALCACVGAASAQGPPPIPLIEQMPRLPAPFVVIDWKARARGFDRLAFDLAASGRNLPLPGIVDKPVNIPPPAFALPSYVGGGRGRGEGICCIAAVVGRSLVGADKTSQGSLDWPRMCREWFNDKNGQRVVLNGPGARTGASFWYEVFPGVLFCHLVDRYPHTPGLDSAMRAMADRWREACVALGGPEGRIDFNSTSFDLAAMKPVFNGRWREPDAAAGIAYIEYTAWRKWRDPRHLEAARWCMDFLERIDATRPSPLYEVLLLYAPALAARMNVEHGCHYDVDKFLQWIFSNNDREGAARPGWGIVAGRWGDYDTAGLQGSTKDSGGYAFAMNSFQAASAIAPLARYDARYARAIGKWLLNVAAAARLFFPDALPADHQSCPGWKSDPPDVVCYEGLRRQGALAPLLMAEQTTLGRLLRGTPAEGVSPAAPIIFAADEHGRLHHVWEFAIPSDAASLPFSLRIRAEAPADAFVLSAAYDGNGPWRMLAKLPRAKDHPGDAASIGVAIPDPTGRDRLFLKIEAADGCPPRASLSIEAWHSKIPVPRFPFAQGDAQTAMAGPRLDLAIYGAAHVGYLAALVERTNHEHILQFDLLATDFFHGPAHPTFLYYNPDAQSRSVSIDVGNRPRDLYDATSHRFVARGVLGQTPFLLGPDSAAVIVLPPAGGKVVRTNAVLLVDGAVIDHACAAEP